MDLLEKLKQLKTQTQDDWEREFGEAREFLVLRHSGGGGSKSNGFWIASAYFLAYVDVRTGELHRGEGRLQWPVSDDEQKKGGCFGRFAEDTVYRVIARPKISPQPEGLMSSAQNALRVVEVLDQKVPCVPLEELLAAYRKPVTLEDDVLGTLELNREFDWFEGEILWCGEEVEILLEVDSEDPATWAAGQQAMRSMMKQQERWDTEMRAFSAKQLTELACDWRNEADPEITEQSFARRIELQTIVMSPDGSFVAHFGDDEMFLGHVVAVYGHLETGLKSAQMEG